MDNATPVIRPPPPPPPPTLVAAPPISPSFDNTTNGTNIAALPPPPLPFLTQPQIYPIENTSITIIKPPPPFPAAPRSVDLSPLEFILALMAVITIPALIYAFFFAVRCPSWRQGYQSSDDIDGGGGGGVEAVPVAGVKAEVAEAVSGVKYRKEAHVKDIGSECPVCLSVFVEGEEVRQLSACKHSFHATCIDMWLSNHSNCPICRASVAVKRPDNNNNNRTAPSSRNQDLHQGLPDAASLV